jgi:DNA-binding beta-propeller fold protein YncE
MRANLVLHIKEEKKKLSNKYRVDSLALKVLSMLLIISVLAMLTGVTRAVVTSRTYTKDADFDEGVLVGVEHETVHDQLQLSKRVTTLPFTWVSNNNNTVSKVDTVTGKELGRYYVSSEEWSAPSRTTVDLRGNCWVGLRQRGTVVKVGLYEAGEWIDRNGDGVCQTSNDTDSDGNISWSEILPWGQDECVLFEVVLVPGFEGAYAPGAYSGPYDFDYWGVAPRGLAIDSQSNLWAGTWSTGKYYHINGTTGAIMRTVDVSAWNHHAYGTIIDKNGVLWSAQLWDHILRINTSDFTDITKIELGHVYGIGLDYFGHLFAGGNQYLSKIDTHTGTVLWTKESRAFRGVVCTTDNNVWVAGYDEFGNYNSVSRYDNDGNLITTIPVGLAPSGVAVDAAGEVWVCDIEDEYIHRINPETNTISLSKAIIGSDGHYTYSDMTGIVSRTLTTRIGSWTVVFDSEAPDTPWGILSWSSFEPIGTSVTVRARSSDDDATWSGWENAVNGVALSSTPNGRYLQIEVMLQIIKGEISPILYDLTVQTMLTPGKTTGGGQIEIPLPSSKTGKGSFGFNIIYQEGDQGPKGVVQYIDPTTKMNVHSQSITSLVVSPDKKKASFGGQCTINEVSGFTFTVSVEDNGEPGKNDVFKISLSNGYSAGSTLCNGNIQIHQKP